MGDKSLFARAQGYKIGMLTWPYFPAYLLAKKKGAERSTVEFMSLSLGGTERVPYQINSWEALVLFMLGGNRELGRLKCVQLLNKWPCPNADVIYTGVCVWECLYAIMLGIMLSGNPVPYCPCRLLLGMLTNPDLHARTLIRTLCQESNCAWAWLYYRIWTA